MASNKKNSASTYKTDFFRLMICAVLSCASIFVTFSLYKNQFTEKIAELTEKGDAPNAIWLLEHISAAIPVLVVALIMCIFYRGKDKYVPVHYQREKLYISLIAAAVTLIAFIFINVTDGAVDAKDEVKSLLESTYMWFAAQIIPFTVLISYHAVRMGSEKKELEG